MYISLYIYIYSLIEISCRESRQVNKISQSLFTELENIFNSIILRVKL